MSQRHLLRAALPLLVLVSGAAFIRASSARADAAPRVVGGAHPWRSMQAPGDLLALSGYLAPPPGGGEGDSTDVGPKGERPPTGGGNTNPNPNPNPTVLTQPGGGTVPDTAKTSRFNHPFGDTLRPFSSNAQETGPPRPGARRGILGIHPLAILAALIALDIFVVTVAGK